MIIGAILGLLFGAIIVYIIQRPKLKATQQLDSEIGQQNLLLREQNDKLKQDLTTLTLEREKVVESIHLLETQANQAADVFYKKSMELAETNFENEATKLGKQVQEWKDEANQEYLLALKENMDSFNQQLQEKRVELKTLDEELIQMRQTVSAAVEADKRAAELAQKTDFYRLILSEEDILEIARLRDVEQFLRDKEPLNKVIWKVYYEKPYTDLIGRVVGTGIHTGIYKITNITNGMCYVGQAVNVGR